MNHRMHSGLVRCVAPAALEFSSSEGDEWPDGDASENGYATPNPWVKMTEIYMSGESYVHFGLTRYVHEQT